MALCNAIAVTLGRYTRANVLSYELYNIRHLIIVTELGKLSMAAILESRESEGGLRASLRKYVWNQPTNALKMVFPSALYFLNNVTLYVALERLSVPVFQLLYQSKLIFTALLSVLFLGRTYRTAQWICIVLLSVGIAIIIVGENDMSMIELKQGQFFGIGAVVVSGIASSLAYVYFEKVVKSKSPNESLFQELTPLWRRRDRQSQEEESSPPLANDNSLDVGNHIVFDEEVEEAVGSDAAADLENTSAITSLWMRTIQLSFFTTLVAIGREIYLDYEDNFIESTPFFHGFTIWVWLLVFIQAFGGILVSAVIFHTDNVIKGFATAVSILLSALFSVILLGNTTYLSPNFFVGSFLVLGAVVVFGMHVSVGIANGDNDNNKSDGKLFCLILRPTAIPRTNTTAETSNARESMATPLLGFIV